MLLVDDTVMDRLGADFYLTGLTYYCTVLYSTYKTALHVRLIKLVVFQRSFFKLSIYTSCRYFLILPSSHLLQTKNTSLHYLVLPSHQAQISLNSGYGPCSQSQLPHSYMLTPPNMPPWPYWSWHTTKTCLQISLCAPAGT